MQDALTASYSTFACMNQPARWENLRSGWKIFEPLHRSLVLTQSMFSSELHLLGKHSGKFEICKETKPSSPFTTLAAFLTITQGCQMYFGKSKIENQEKNSRRNNDKVTSTQPGRLLPLRPPPLPRPLPQQLGPRHHRDDGA